MGNGDSQDASPYRGDRRKLHQGRALVVVRTLKKTGVIRLTAAGPGLDSASLTLEAKPAIERPEI